MGVMPGYKQTEVGVIPEEWDVRVLASVSEKIMVGIASAATHAYRDKGVALLRNQNIKVGYLDDADVLYVAPAYEAVFKNKRLKTGDLLTARTGYPGTTCVVPDKFEEAQSFTTLITRPQKEAVDSQYLCYYINSEHGQEFFEQSQIGGAQKNVNAGSLQKMPIPLPPLPEQRAIAAALSDMDALIASLDRLIAKKRDMKQAAMQELLTGKRRLSGFSGEWEAKRLGELFSFSGGFTASRAQLSDSGYCYLHYGDIHKSSKTFIDVDAEILVIPKLDVRLEDVSASAMLKDGDIVFVDASEDEEGTSKHVVIINPSGCPYISGLHTIVAKAKSDDLDNGFKRYCFQTRSIKEQFRFYAVGTKVSGISKTNIAKIELSFPSRPEQSAIAAILSDMDTEIAALEQKRHKTRLLKQGMMQELLTGRIRLV